MTETISSAKRPIGERLTLLALTAAIFFSPFLHLRIIPDIFITYSDILFVVAAVLLLFTGRLSSAPLGRTTPIWLLAVIALITPLVLSSVVYADPTRGLIVGAQYAFAYMLLPFLIIRNDEEFILRMMKMFMAAVVVVEVVGLIIYYVFSGTYEENQKFGHDFISGSGRLGSFIGDANWNGAAVAMTIPITLYLMSKQALSPYIGAPVLLALVGGLIHSASFTGFASASCALAIYMIASGKGMQFFKISLGMVACVAVLFVAGFRAPEVFQKRVFTAVETGDVSKAGTFTGRMVLMREAWDMVDGTMVLGLGADQYRVVSHEKAPVHNQYLLVWAEGGIVSLLGWMAMIAILFAIAIDAVRVSRLAAALILSVLLTFIVQSIGSPHMYSRLWVVPVVLALGAALASRRVHPAHPQFVPDRDRDRPGSRLILPRASAV